MSINSCLVNQRQYKPGWSFSFLEEETEVLINILSFSRDSIGYDDAVRTHQDGHATAYAHILYHSLISISHGFPIANFPGH